MHTTARLAKTKLRSKTFFNIFLILAILSLFIAVGAVWFARRGDEPWRAIFLTNNQVYFGHFFWLPFVSTVTISDIYYLQAAKPLQQTEADRPAQQSEIKIIKFGGEIHGPTDEMVIMKRQILFWENLKDDSPVVKKITENKN